MAGGGLYHAGECECCGRERDVAVVSSAYGPVSFALCLECLQRPAEPVSVFKYLYDDVAQGDPSRLDASVKNHYTWIDGKYVHWDNYVYRRKHPDE